MGETENGLVHRSNQSVTTVLQALTTCISAQTELNLSRDRLLYEMYSGKPRPTCIRSYLTLEERVMQTPDLGLG